MQQELDRMTAEENRINKNIRTYAQNVRSRAGGVAGTNYDNGIANITATVTREAGDRFDSALEVAMQNRDVIAARENAMATTSAVRGVAANVIPTRRNINESNTREAIGSGNVNSEISRQKGVVNRASHAGSLDRRNRQNL